MTKEVSTKFINIRYGKALRVMEKKKIFGKTCVINSLAISKLIYVGSVLPILEDSLIKKIKSSIFNFIWDKRDRIKRNDKN